MLIHCLAFFGTARAVPTRCATEVDSSHQSSCSLLWYINELGEMNVVRAPSWTMSEETSFVGSTCLLKAGGPCIPAEWNSGKKSDVCSSRQYIGHLQVHIGVQNWSQDNDILHQTRLCGRPLLLNIYWVRFWGREVLAIPSNVNISRIFSEGQQMFIKSFYKKWYWFFLAASFIFPEEKQSFRLQKTIRALFSTSFWKSC